MFNCYVGKLLRLD